MQGPDGSVYTGGWLNDVKHGLGRKEYTSGDVYEVCVLSLEVLATANSASNFLVQTEHESLPLAISRSNIAKRATILAIAATAFVVGLRDLMFCLIVSWLRLVQGLWKNGKMEGPGRYCWKNKNEYDGEWRAGKMHGQGTIKWASGAPAESCC